MISIRKQHGNKITAAMQIRNEADRYLQEVLEHLSLYVDEIVIVDDNSTDASLDICKKIEKVVRISELKENMFENEIDLRKHLFEEVRKTKPDWILFLDADEMLEDRALYELRPLIEQDQYDWVGFRLFDFWGCRTHYRDDQYWKAHRYYDPLLIRYIEGFPEVWREQPVHTGRFPLSYYYGLPGTVSSLRVKHYGWAGDEDERKRKYLRYMKTDPDGVYGSLQQYQSILDPSPNLVKWEENLR